MTILATDSFNRADNADLGTDWDAHPLLTQPFAIATNRAKCTNSSGDGTETNNTANWPNDQYSEALYDVTGTNAQGTGYGVVCRADTAVKTYYWFVANGTGYALARFNTGTFTSLASSGTTAFIAGDKAKLQLRDSVWSAFKNGSIFVNGTDSSIASGRVGITYSDPAGTSSTGIESWEGGDLVPESDGFGVIAQQATYGFAA